METLVNSSGARAALGLSRTRCTATTKATGAPCTRWAILGGFVCVVHGGGTPVVKDAAQQRLLQLVDPALHGMRLVLIDLIAEWEIAQELLDRASRVAN